MQSLLLLKADSSSFEPSEVERTFRADSGFQELRLNTHAGKLTECDYVELDDRAIVSLSDDREWIALSNTGHAALQAVLIIQRSLGIPLRLLNSSYTFDLTFSNVSTVDQLEAAMEGARTS